jgi:uncharacterized protein (TIGR03382 family)
MTGIMRPTAIAVAGLSLAVALSLSGTVHGGLLYLDLEETPDIFSAFIDVSYEAATDHLLVEGFALTIDDDSSFPPDNIFNGRFEIDATIDKFGRPVDGILSIEGDVFGLGRTLLTGSLKEFGFINGGGNLFEFIFTVTGGDLATPQFYGQPGTQMGVLLHGVNFGGSFNQDFANFGIGLADTAPVPVAPTLAVLLIAFARRQRRRRR